MSILSNHLYKDVLAISQSYFGGAAKSFVDGQIANHLDKQPGQLQTSDLPLLIDWIKISVNLLTDDNQTVQRYIKQLQALTKERSAVR